MIKDILYVKINKIRRKFSNYFNFGGIKMGNRINYENLILNLYMFNKIQNRGNTFAVKLMYIFEEKLFHNNMIGSRYIIHRDRYGPYNKEIIIDLENLAKSGFLDLSKIYYEKYDYMYNLYLKNSNTNIFLREIEDLIQENSIIFNIFDEIIDEFGNYNGRELKEYVYSLDKTGIKNKKMKNYRKNEIILDPLILENPITKFELDEDWYDTIEVLLDPELYEEHLNAINDVREGNVIMQ